MKESERLLNETENAVDRIIKRAYRDARVSYLSLDQIVDLIHSLQIEEVNYHRAKQLEREGKWAKQNWTIIKSIFWLGEIGWKLNPIQWDLNLADKRWCISEEKDIERELSKWEKSEILFQKSVDNDEYKSV